MMWRFHDSFLTSASSGLKVVRGNSVELMMET